MKQKTNRLGRVQKKLQERFLEVFEKKLCNVSETCKAINISRQTYYNWLDNFDTFKKECESIQEGFYDMLESKMFKKAVVDEDNTMLIFLAKTKMKHRGYIERSEIKTEVVEDIDNRSAEEIQKELDDLRKDYDRSRKRTKTS